MNELLKSQWYPVCHTRQMKENSLYKFILCDTPIIVLRNGNELYAYIDKCPHRGMPLSAGKIKRGLIQCAYHGWKFDHSGQCVEVPGLCSSLKPKNKQLSKLAVQVMFDVIFVCLDHNDTTNEIYKPELFSLSGYTYFIKKYAINGDLLNIVENLLDATHTNFVHYGWLRTDDYRENITATVTVTPSSAEVFYPDKDPRGIISRLFEINRSHSIGRFHFPIVVELEYHAKNGLRFAVCVYLTPKSGNNYQVMAFVFVKGGFIFSSLKWLLFQPFFQTIINQDKHLLAMQDANLQYFPEAQFISTELDLLRAHIERILSGKSLNYSKSIKMNL